MKSPTPAQVTQYVVWGTVLAGAGVASFFTLRAAGLIGELPRASGGSLLVDMMTMAGSKEHFVRGMMSAAAQARPGLSVEARKLLAAWAAYESGWGKTNQAKMGFNVFNVSKGAWTGPTLTGGDTEFVVGSAVSRTITQQWRQYDSMVAAVNDVLGLLERSRYVNYREAYAKLVAGDPTFATSLGVLDNGPDGKKVRVDNRPDTAGYFTHPRSDYQRQVTSIFGTVNQLVLSSGISAAVQS